MAKTSKLIDTELLLSFWLGIKSKLSKVATSGSYNDLSDKPTIPSVGNGKIIINQGGTQKGTFTVNQTGNTTIDLTDNNTTYEIATSSSDGLMSAQDKKNSVPLVIGTQTAVTGSFVGATSEISELYDGLTIKYWLPYNGSGNATLNLTLANGTTTGAKAIYVTGTSRLTTHYAAGNIITMTYRIDALIGTTKYTGWWCSADRDANDYYRLRYQNAIKAGSTSIVANNLIVGMNGTYSHLKLGKAFDITYPIMVAISAIAAGATGTNNYVFYPFTLTTTQAGTYVAYKPVYIKGKLSGTTFTPVSTAPLTQTIPTSADGYQYILLGTMYSTTQLYLISEHNIYEYSNGAFREYDNGATLIFTEEAVVEPITGMNAETLGSHPASYFAVASDIDNIRSNVSTLSADVSALTSKTSSLISKVSMLSTLSSNVNTLTNKLNNINIASNSPYEGVVTANSFVPNYITLTPGTWLITTSGYCGYNGAYTPFGLGTGFGKAVAGMQPSWALTVTQDTKVYVWNILGASVNFYGIAIWGLKIK